MTQSRSTRATIVQLLSNMTDGKEIRSYLQRFAEVDQSRFAVIKIGGAILEDNLQESAAALAFLHTVGLTPIVLHGGGPQLDAALAAKGLGGEKIDGLRVTDDAVLDVARDVFMTENIKLVEAVRKEGVDAHSLTAGAIEADYIDRDRLGYVGAPTKVRLDLISSVVRSGAVPILTCLGVSPGGQLLNVNGDTATRALVEAVAPLKIIFLSSVGGLLGHDGEPLHSINLATDFDGLMHADWVQGGMRLKLQEIKKLLDAAPMSSSASITTPAELIKELFTHGGSGTLVRRGELIKSYADKTAIDRAKAEHLVSAAFGRQVKPEWWQQLRIQDAHISESYRAGALISQVDDFLYLDKFAVLDDARGEGLARTVWRKAVHDKPVMFWRSRTDNGFNAFYHNVAAGAVKTGPWTVFWIGEPGFDQIGRVRERIAALPGSFEGDDEA